MTIIKQLEEYCTLHAKNVIVHKGKACGFGFDPLVIL